MAVIINASTSTGLVQSADTSGIIQFQSNGSTKATLNSSGFSYPGAVLQVVQTVKTNTFTSSATSFTNITGLTATITPASASNKILVMASVVVGITQNYFVHIRLARGGSPILQGDAAGSRRQTLGMIYSYPGLSPANEQTTWSHQVVDSPASTSSLTYSVQIMQQDGSTQYINRLQRDDDAYYEPRSASSIILMEIAA